MTITDEQIRLAEKIDAWVKGVVSQGGGDEQLLEGMYAYMDTFKKILDTTGRRDIDALCQRYDGFCRFARLLELIAQGLADGVITVPEETPRLRKKRPRKPKPGRRQNRKKAPQLIRRSIEYLPAFTEAIVGSLQQTEEQYGTFLEVRHEPHVLDDALVDRATRLYEDQLEGIPHLEQQLQWLLEDDISDAQRHQVQDLLAKLPALREKTESLLALLAELRQRTINRILEMDDEELGWRYLRGEL